MITREQIEEIQSESREKGVSIKRILKNLLRHVLSGRLYEVLAVLEADGHVQELQHAERHREQPQGMILRQATS